MYDELKLISEVKSSVEALGAERVIEVLQTAKSQKFGGDVTSFLLEKISEAIGIPISDISNASIKSNDKKIAIAFYAHFLNHTFGFSFRKIARTFPRLHSSAFFQYHSAFIKKAKLVNPKSDIDRLISQYIHPLSEIIQTYKSSPNGSK
jgi:hypothetical protein